MEEEIYEDEPCDEKDVIRPYLSKRPDVLTEEGKKEFFEKAKNQTIENYKDELRSKTEDELTDKAMEEAAKELGISLDELVNPRGRRNRFFALRERDNNPKYTEEQTHFYEERVASIQKRQNEIVELMSNKEKHLIMDKSHTRNAVVTEYLHLETLKCRFLDILTAAYTGKSGCQDAVDHEGSSFTKRLDD